MHGQQSPPPQTKRSNRILKVDIIMKVYHVIREDKPQYEVGDVIVSPFEYKRDFSFWKPYKRQAEELLEKERLNNFPFLPSRYDSLFVAETSEQAEEWIRNK